MEVYEEIPKGDLDARYAVAVEYARENRGKWVSVEADIAARVPSLYWGDEQYYEFRTSQNSDGSRFIMAKNFKKRPFRKTFYTDRFDYS